MYTYIGCFQDRTERLFPVGPYTKRNNEMSTSICFNYCKKYKYFATEVRNECFCGETLRSGQYPKLLDVDCNLKCNGHITQTCGGTWTASVYEINKNEHEVSTTNQTPISPKQSSSDIGHQLSTTKDTPTNQKTSNYDIAGISIYPIIIVPVLVMVLIAALVVILLLYNRRKRGNNLGPCEISQYQTITERISSPSYTAISYHQKTDISNIPQINKSRQSITVSKEQEESNCNNYESLSKNRKSVEHIYQSEYIHNNQLSMGEVTHDSIKEALPASTEQEIVQYQSLTKPLESDTHVYALTSVYSNVI